MSMRGQCEGHYEVNMKVSMRSKEWDIGLVGAHPFDGDIATIIHKLELEAGGGLPCGEAGSI